MNHDKYILISISQDELRNMIECAVREALNELPENEVVQPEEDQLMTIKDVSNFFGKSRQTIYDWMKKGLLPFHKISNRTYFLKKDLMGALNRIELRKTPKAKGN